MAVTGFIRRTSGWLAVILALVVVAAGAGAAHAAPRPAHPSVPAGGGAAAKPAAGQPASASGSAPCDFWPAVTTCASTDPAISLEWSNFSDTTGCAFDYSIDWGDGSPQTSGSVTGGAIGTSLLASHAYSSAGTYDIAMSGSVTAGDCVFDPGSARFTYQVAPVAGCDFYWALPGQQLRVPAFLGLFGNDSDPAQLPFTAKVTKVSFGVSSHPYSVDQKTGSFVLQPGPAGHTLVITYVITDSAGLKSAPAQVRILVQGKRPPVSAAGNCAAPQFLDPFSGAGSVITNPKSGYTTDAAWICGSTKFRWWTDKDAYADPVSRVLETGPGRCVFMFSNLVSQNLISAALSSKYTVSEVLVRTLARTYSDMKAANLDVPDHHPGSDVFADFTAEALHEVEIKVSVETIKSKLPQLVEDLGALFEMVETAGTVVTLSSLAESLSKYFQSVTSGEQNYLGVEADNGCLQEEIGVQKSGSVRVLRAYLQVDGATKYGLPTTYGHVTNSKNSRFDVSMQCRDGLVVIASSSLGEVFKSHAALSAIDG